MPHRFKHCIIHIGTEKTGTSSIQQFLEHNRRSLAQEGVFYPHLGKGGSQWELVAVAHPQAWKDAGLSCHLGIKGPEDLSIYKAQLTVDLDNQFSAVARCDKLVVSSEHFHSRLQNAKTIARLKDFLDRWCASYQIVVYFRRQDRVAVSLNSTRVKSGATNPEAGLPATIDKIPRYYHYDKIFNDWANVFARDAITPVIYKDNRNSADWLLKNFCSTAGISFDGKANVHNHNPSLNEPGLRILAAINRILDEAGDENSNLHRRLAVGILSDRYRGKHFFVTRKQAMRFQALFADTNERLRQAGFPARHAPLFDDEFDEYPETDCESSIDDEEVMSLARQTLDEADQLEHMNKYRGFWRRLFGKFQQ